MKLGARKSLWINTINLVAPCPPASDRLQAHACHTNTEISHHPPEHHFRPFLLPKRPEHHLHIWSPFGYPKGPRPNPLHLAFTSSRQPVRTFGLDGIQETKLRTFGLDTEKHHIPSHRIRNLKTPSHYFFWTFNQDQGTYSCSYSWTYSCSYCSLQDHNSSYHVSGRGWIWWV